MPPRTIYQLIAERKMLNKEQQLGLLHCLTFRQRFEVKEAIRNLLNNKFYTIFDGMEFGKQFRLLENGLEFKPLRPENELKELKAIRDYILLVGSL